MEKYYGWVRWGESIEDLQFEDKENPVLASVGFNKGFSYYDTSHEVADEDDNGDELGDLWNKADDEEFGKVMTGRQVIRKDAIFAYPTHQSHKGSVVADSEEERDNDSLPESALDNDYPLPSQLIPPPVVPSEISSPLTNISKTNTPPLPEAFQDLDEDLLESATTDQPGSSCQIPLKIWSNQTR